MTKLVRDGKYVVRGFGIVKENVGVNAVNAAGVRAAALALRFFYVDPALVVCFL